MLFRSNKAFIDWEKGESHLTEEPFLSLMAFAKEYADQGGYPRSEVGERLADGRIAGEQISLVGPEMLQRARGCFNGDEACIGYPRESGSGIYMETGRLYLNRNAGNRETAIVSLGLLEVNFLMLYLYNPLLQSLSQKYETAMLEQKVQVYVLSALSGGT